MRLGLAVGYWGLGLSSEDQLSLVRAAEDAGWDSVWGAEAYGSDTATVLAWLASQTSRIRIGSGIFQMPGRSPAMTAMTAATLDILSNGRMMVGIGSSGPPGAGGGGGQRFGQGRLGPAGGRGVARPALRQADPADARVHRDPSQGARAGAPRVRRRGVRAAAARRTGQSAQTDDLPHSGSDADLPRRDRTEQHEARRRDRRRLHAVHLRPRARGGRACVARGGRVAQWP